MAVSPVASYALCYDPTPRSPEAPLSCGRGGQWKSRAAPQLSPVWAADYRELSQSEGRENRVCNRPKTGRSPASSCDHAGTRYEKGVRNGQFGPCLPAAPLNLLATSATTPVGVFPRATRPVLCWACSSLSDRLLTKRFDHESHGARGNCIQRGVRVIARHLGRSRRADLVSHLSEHTLQVNEFRAQQSRA
jgi:hypothetical protein